MKIKGKFLLLTIAMFVQSYSIVQMFKPVYHHWPAPFFFLLGVEPETIYIVLLMWYVVFVSLSFYFLGNVSENLHGFGKYMLIRNFSKTKFILNQYIAIAVKLLGFLFLQAGVYYLVATIMRHQTSGPVDVSQLIKASFIYYLTLLVLLLLQMMLELFVTPQNSLLFVNMYVVFSIVLAGVLFTFKRMQPLLYVLIPNFMMSLRTDILNGQHFTIHYSMAVIVLFLLLAAIIGLSMQRIKTKDIF
jgi:hypothetical protein